MVHFHTRRTNVIGKGHHRACLRDEVRTQLVALLVTDREGRGHVRQEGDQPIAIGPTVSKHGLKERIVGIELRRRQTVIQRDARAVECRF
jgi:hypothetical protein